MSPQNAGDDAERKAGEAAVAAQTNSDASVDAEGAAPAPPAAEGSGEEPALPKVVTNVEEAGPCARTLKIDVPKERVLDEIDKSYEELRKTVFIKGFRRGRVPRHVLERRFSEQVLDGVKEAMVNDSFSGALEEHSLRLALPPTIDYETIAFGDDRSLSFELKVEVFPEFTIDNYKGLAVDRPRVEVTPADMDRALEGFRLRRGEYRKTDEGEVGENDIPICHAIAMQDGEEIWREDELGVYLSAETVGGMHVPGLRDALVGARAGESRTFAITLPDDFKAEKHRGKAVQLEVTIDELRRFEAPEATDEWARSLHFEDLEDLTEELGDELRRQREQEADDVVEGRIAERLLELTDFDVPEGLVARIADRAKERQRLALLYRGTPEDEIDARLKEAETQTRDESTRHCKLYFIYEKIAEQEKIFVTEDELDQRIQAIALNYRRRPEEVRAQLETEERLSSLRQQMREEKVRDFLVQNANVTEAGAPPAEPAGQAEAPPEEPAGDDAPEGDPSGGADS